MQGIPRGVTKNSLWITLGSKPIKQWFCHCDEEKRNAIGEEMGKLLIVGFIMEVYLPEWLANLVLVRKKNGKWRICIDYTSLNKACPKNPSPFPLKEQVAESTSRCEVLSFLDTYCGYHQIEMKESNQPAISFITPFTSYYFMTMPFGLKMSGPPTRGA